MRELRVEDALLYLDQVKIEFGDRPHIYNEFLDIMKTFKTQQIDTPGVIRRVSTLFQGNKRLVLGFNTFLPEGYKIEIPVDGDGPPVAVYRVPGQPGVRHILGPAQGAEVPPSGPAVAASAAAGQPPAAVAQQQPQQGAARPPPQQQQHMHPSQRPGGMQQHAHAQHGPPTHQPQSQHQQPFKSQQQQQPFKNQQQQQQGPAGMGPSASEVAGGMVVDQSSTSAGSGSQYQQHLPRVHSQQQAMQIHQAQQRGQQQPPSQQMSADQQGRGNGQEQQPPRPAQHHQQPGGIAGQQPVGLDGKVGSAPSRMGTGAQQAPPSGAPHPGIMQHPHPNLAQAPQQPQPPVEFDHAINYVTTIKKRFAAEPEIYKKFLEILHTYQKEQRGIKDVLDEVSVLFADHPDLLKEFTYFLPDAVQAQAKAQLDQVAKESEMRIRAASSKQAIMQTAGRMQRQAHGLPPVRVQPPAGTPATSGGMSGPGGVYALAPAPVPFGANQGRSDEREREICRGAVYGAVSFSPVRPPRRAELTVSQAAVKNGRPNRLKLQPLQPSTAESAFFERAKLHLSRKELAPDKPPGSRRHTPYTEFLKCLHLYGAGILNKEELFLLLRGLFMQGHAPKSGANAGGGATNPTVASDAQELLREFEEIMVGRGPYADQETTLKDKSKYGSLSSRDFDFSNCERPTPSYRKYPSDYPHNLFLAHSGQTENDAAVLNGSVISVPERSSKQRGTISLEDYDGVRARRNAYEEAMFRVEDERYEVDMAIQRNASTMRQAEPVAEEANRLRDTEEKDGQPIGRMRYRLRHCCLNVAHVNAIGRLYGEKGDEVIQHLIRNPIVVFPIVQQRLRDKDTEWRKAKAEMTKRWKSTCKSNFEGSTDVLCYFYRKEIERSFLSEQLLKECKQAKLFSSLDGKQPDHPATRPFQPEFLLSSPIEGTFLFQPHLRLHLPSGIAHKDAFQCIVHQMLHGASISSGDRERVGRIWAEFMVPWFDYPVHWVLSELRESLNPGTNSFVVKYAPGQLVRTAHGDGRIVSVREGKHETGVGYKVMLPYGTAYIRPSAIIHSLPATDGPVYARTGGQMKSIEHADDAVQDDKKLPSTCGLLFATEATYVFLRLYGLLVSILSDTREHLKQTESPKLHSPPIENDEEKGATTMDVDEPEEQVEKGALPAESTDSDTDSDTDTDTEMKYNYAGVMSSLHKLLGHDIDHKTYESYCRKVSKEKVHQLAAVPKLVRSCSDALLKVAKEDLLPSLFDWSQLKGQDPWQLRPRCLTVSDKACYRIQFDSRDKYMSFAYLPSEEALLTSPQEPLMEDEGESGTPTDEENVSNSMEIDEPEDDLHVAKRPKLE